MAEPSSAGPSSQAQVPLHSVDMDIERGPAGSSSNRGSRDAGDTSGDEDFVHLFIVEKNAAMIDQMPSGWIKLAAERNLFHNRRTIRRFGTLNQKLVLSGLKYLAAKESEIDEMLESPDGNERFTWEDPLLQQTRAAYLELVQLHRMDDYLRKLPQANLDQHVAAYKHMRLDHEFSEADAAYMLRHEDIVQPQTDPTDVIINSLLYSLSDGGIHSWIQSAIYYLFGRGIHTKFRSSRPVNIESLNFYFSLLIMLTGELSLLSPVLVLYLVDMQKSVTAGVVVAFVIMLTPVIYFTTTTRFGNALFGLVAYMAVLVTFLAQLGSGG